MGQDSAGHRTDRPEPSGGRLLLDLLFSAVATDCRADSMIFGWKSNYERFLEGEVERLRNEARVLLSALLERTVSREAALMLRTETELDLSKKSMIDRASVHYEALRAAKEKTSEPAPIVPDIRHWRGARAEMEAKSAAEVAAANSNDSVERIENKVAAAKQAAREA